MARFAERPGETELNRRDVDRDRKRLDVAGFSYFAIIAEKGRKWRYFLFARWTGIAVRAGYSRYARGFKNRTADFEGARVQARNRVRNPTIKATAPAIR
jgi:hypothetical protein